MALNATFHSEYQCPTSWWEDFEFVLSLITVDCSQAAAMLLHIPGRVVSQTHHTQAEAFNVVGASNDVRLHYPFFRSSLAAPQSSALWGIVELTGRVNFDLQADSLTFYRCLILVVGRSSPKFPRWNQDC